MDAFVFAAVRGLAALRPADTPAPEPADEYRMQYRANRVATGAPR